MSQKCEQWRAMKSALPSSIFRYIHVLILQRFQADYDNLMRFLWHVYCRRTGNRIIHIFDSVWFINFKRTRSQYNSIVRCLKSNKYWSRVWYHCCRLLHRIIGCLKLVIKTCRSEYRSRTTPHPPPHYHPHCKPFPNLLTLTPGQTQYISNIDDTL